MRLRTFLFHCLPVVSCLVLGFLLLSSCDSGADFSSLGDLSSSEASVPKVQAWYHEQTQFAVSENLSKISGDDDSFGLSLLVQKFPPDWSKAVVLSGKDGNQIMGITLGHYTNEKYDTTSHHVRTILFDLDTSGDVESSNIIIFSSRDELRRDGFDTYLKQYLTKDFGDVEMAVSRYTVRFEAVDAFLYRPDQFPLELSMSFTNGEDGIETLSNNSSDFCFFLCKTIHLGTSRCVYGSINSPGFSPWNSSQCYPNLATACSNFCFPSTPHGNNGGNNGDGSGNNGNQCACAAQEQCDLANEYSSNRYTCHDFTDFHPNFTIDDTGNENGKHGDYALINYRLPELYSDITNFIRGLQVYDPVAINSGYRCLNGNANVPGASLTSKHPGASLTSKHIHGRALDIKIYNSSAWNTDLKEAIKEENLRLYSDSDSYVDSWVHISM